ncbi:MAG: DUF6777 domain-containing protein, partial [Candidatus Nanopelagicales bacterium]
MAAGGRSRAQWLLVGAAAAALLVFAVLGVVLLAGRPAGDEVAAEPSPSIVMLTARPEEPGTSPAATASPPAPASPVPSPPAPASPVPSPPVPGEASVPPAEVIPEVVAAPPVVLTPVNTAADDYTKAYGSDLPIDPVAVAGDLRLLPGDTVGLYGGTMGEKELTCDRSRLADSLESGSRRARTWARTMGASIADVRDFLYALTPVLLRADTLITIHGYADGRDTTTPAVLQAGTAVLVTPQGEPRMRCFGSNPLSPADPPAQDTRVTGDGWATWDPDQAVLIEPASRTLAAFDLADLGQDRI